MKFYSPAGLEELLKQYVIGNIDIMTAGEKPLNESIKDMNQGTMLWKLFIILALIFLATEVALLRFWNSRT